MTATMCRSEVEHEVLEPATASAPGLVLIGRGRKRATYWFQEFASDLGGRAFWLREFRCKEVYHVHVRRDEVTCECMGWLRWQKPCKHICAVVSMMEGVTDG